MEFTKWWLNEFKSVKFPPQGTVFDFYIDSETKQFVSWSEKMPRFVLDSDMPMQVEIHINIEEFQKQTKMFIFLIKQNIIFLIIPKHSTICC